MLEWANLLSPVQGEFWLAIGIMLAILEVIDGNFVLFSLGLGAALTSLVAFAGVDSLPALLGSCIVFEIAVVMLVRPVMLRVGGGDEEVLTNVDALIGKTAVVETEIGGADQSGYVKIQGESWRALHGDKGALAVGTKVRIDSMAGNTVTVSAHTEAVEEGN